MNCFAMRAVGSKHLDKVFTPVAENDLEDQSLASYAVTDGAIFIRTDKSLWKIAEK